MFVRNLLSVGVFVATFMNLQSAAYAFEKTSSPQNPADTVGWDEAVENSLIFSNPFSDTTQIQPTSHSYFMAGLNPDATVGNGARWEPGQNHHDTGTLGVAETGYRTLGRDRFGMGGWEYTARPDALTPPDNKPLQRVYVTAERTFYNTDNKTVVGFATAGHVPGDIEQNGKGWGTGFLMKGFVKERPDGQFRFLVTGGGSNPFSDTGHARPLDARFELTYQDKLADNITIQPGLNFTVNSRNDPTAASTGLIAGMRLHIKFK